MKFASITLAGFKSFADRICIQLHKQKMMVVGPNGCGKSNIVDALRWVMGESRASQLRQGQSRDMIFNGAAGRRPADWCSVELRIINDGSRDLGMWGGFTELAVKRQVERAGESNYFINGQRVRRRDVADLFAGTGSGARSYGIVEQDHVTQLVQSEPLRIRSYLEDAAGVAIYKERRRETERRLEAAAANMARLDDQHQSIQQQMDQLHRQARQTTRARKLQVQLKDAQALVATLRLEELRLQEKSANEQVQAAEKKLSDLREKTDGAEQKEAKARLAREEAGKAHTNALSKKYKTDGDLEVLRGKQRELTAQRSRAEQEKTAADEAQQEAIAQRDAIKTSIGELEASLVELGQTSQVSIESLGQTEQKLVGARKKAAEAKESLNKAQQTANSIASQRHEAASAVELAAHRLADLDESIKEANKELSLLPAASKPDEQQEQKQKDIVAKAAADANEAVASMRAKTQELQILREDMVRLQSNAGGIEGELELLNRMSQRAATKHADWFERHAQQGAERLAKVAHIRAPGLERALDAIIGRHLEGFVVASLEKAHGSEDLPEGVSLVAAEACAKLPKQAVPPGTESLAEKITASDQWQSLLRLWLHGVYLAPDGKVARGAAANLQPGQLVVTPAGEIWGSGYALGLQNREAGMEWIAAIEKAEGRLADIESKITKKSAAISAAEKACKDLEGKQATAAQHHQLQQESLGRIEVENKRRVHEVEFLNDRRRRLNDLIDRSTKDQKVRRLEHTNAQTALQALEKKSTAAHSDVMQKQSSVKQAENEIELLRSAQTEHTDAKRSATQSAEHARERLTDMRARSAALAETITQAVARGKQARALLASDSTSKLTAELAASEKLATQAAAVLTTAEAAVDTTKAAEVAASQALVELRTEAETLREDVYAKSLSASQLKSDAQACAKQLKELAPEDERIARLRTAHGSEEDAAALVSRIERSIERIGPVNYAVDAELAACEERVGEIVAQRDDLQTASDELREAVSRIDREMLARLQDVYARLNKRFDELFKILFDGGEAELALTGESLLDAGLQLRATPPGKRVASIQSLSGGEKTLVALAFLFALNDLNPPPLCILDEVDAALDDENSKRFSNLIGSMGDRSSFLIVSHNKTVIEGADQLIGVTQERKGISKIVSVNLNEVLETSRQAAAQ